MDFDLKQWRDDSDAQQPDSAAKLPGLELLTPHPHQQPSAAALPLFVPASTTPAATKYPFSGMENCYFSMSQWQELELQALIFRHMTTGAPVPPELLHLVKKSLISSSPNPSHYFYSHHYNSSLAQSGYWGRTAGMDPEPGRCRRTDGKKWRCSRDVVAGQKYCERHMHRGRNRSRKPVELHASAGSPYATGNAVKSSHSISRPSAGAGDPSANFIHFNQRNEAGGLTLTHPPLSSLPGETGSGPFEAQKLRHFFNDWPKTVDEAETNLTISMPGNMASDFSLKLGYSNGEEREKPQVSWGMGWESNSGPAMGGPLAEALRLSTSGSSPTSVLHLVPRGQGSEASYGSS